MPPFPHAPFDEPTVRAAVVRLHSASGPAGTGFFVLPDALLTCWNVANLRPQTAELADGRTVTLTLSEDESDPGRNLAVFRTDGPTAPAVLACGHPAAPGDAVWSTGFQQPVPEAAGGLPTPATVGGTTDVPWWTARLPVYTLHGAVVNPGLSGAPLVDRVTGSAVGVVFAPHKDDAARHLDGFAIPLTATAGVLARNADTVPGYGRHLNPAGARELCRRHTAAALAELTGSMANGGVYDPERYAARWAEAGVEAFLAADRPLLPVVGHTGVGKSNLLARLATRLAADGRPVLLVRGLHFDPTAAGLADQLDRTLADARYPGADRLTAVATPPLVVLLDGLNEVTFTDPRRAQSWVEQTAAWLRGRRVKVVLTCRPQFWQAVAGYVPEDLCFLWPPATDKDRRYGRDGLALGDFTDAERAEAGRRYGLPAGAAGTGFDAHPFFLRVCAELAAEGEAAGGWTAYEALERYAERVCRRTAAALGQRLDPADVRDLLTALGRLAFAAGGNQLPPAAADRLLAAADPGRQLRQCLLDGRVLERQADGLRFGFDTVAEFFASLGVSAADLDRDGVEWLLGSDLRQGAAVLAVARLEHAGDPAAGRLVTAVCDALVRQRPFRLATAVQLLCEFRNPDHHAGPVARAMAAVAENDDRLFEVVVMLQIGRLARLGRAGVPTVLGLLWPFVRRLRPYTFERGHWSRRSAAWFDGEVRCAPGHDELESCSQVLYRLFEARPAEAAAGLLGWRPDQTPLDNTVGSVTVSDVAAAFLYRFGHLAWQTVCDGLLADGGDGRAYDLLYHLFQLHPDLACDTLDRWSQLPADARRDAAAIRLADGLLARAPTDARVRRSQAAVDRLAARIAPTDEAYPSVLSAWAACPERRDAAWAIVARLPDGWPLVPVSLLGLFAGDRFDRVCAVVDRCLDDRRPELAADCASLVSACTFLHEHTAALVELLHRLLDFVPDEYAVGHAIEKLLDQSSPDSANRPVVMGLAWRCITEPNPVARRCVMYHALDSTHADAAELLRHLLAHEPDDGNIATMINRMAGMSKSFDKLLIRLTPLRQRLLPVQFEKWVMRDLFFSRSSLPAAYFDGWLARADGSSDGSVFAALRAGLRTGEPHRPMLKRLLTAAYG